MDNVREKIVIVEADEGSRISLVSIMQSGGYEVSAFSTAREGLDTLQQNGADLFLLDTDFCCSGALSARETLATVRGSALTSAIRVIALVGSGADNRAAGLDLGADDAVSRPWDATELLAAPVCNCAPCAPTNGSRNKCALQQWGSRSRIRPLTR